MEHTNKYTPENNKFLIKIVVIGDINVGKTNIIRRLLGEEYKEMEATRGVEQKNFQFKFGILQAQNVIVL